jgi:hypothetical protein
MKPRAGRAEKTLKEKVLGKHNQQKDPSRQISEMVLEGDEERKQTEDIRGDDQPRWKR